MRQTRKRFYKKPKKKQSDPQNQSNSHSRSKQKKKKRPSILKLKKTTASMLKHAEFLETEQKKSSKSKQKSGSKGKDRLSEHFSKKDFLCKHCVEKKLERKPFRISLGLIGALEKLRGDVNQRIEIIKGYECVESHELSKSFKKNYHTMGLAAIIQSKAPLDLLLEKALEIGEIKIIEINYDDNTLYIDTRKDPVKEVWEIKKKNRTNVSEKYIKETASTDS